MVLGRSGLSFFRVQYSGCGVGAISFPWYTLGTKCIPEYFGSKVQRSQEIYRGFIIESRIKFWFPISASSSYFCLRENAVIWARSILTWYVNTPLSTLSTIMWIWIQLDTSGEYYVILPPVSWPIFDFCLVRCRAGVLHHVLWYQSTYCVNALPVLRSYCLYHIMCSHDL